ncbi:hypothetical protein [Primorskyibacter sp. S87]
MQHDTDHLGRLCGAAAYLDHGPRHIETPPIIPCGHAMSDGLATIKG